MRKIGKKLLSLALALVMVVGMCPVSAFAAEPTSGTYGKDVTWTFDSSTGKLTIAGAGKMYDVNNILSSDFVSGLPKNSILSVQICDGVTSVGACTFAYCNNLTNVTIAGSVKSIGDYAFSGCQNLTEVDISYGVTEIGEYAFSANNLEKVTIPGSVIRIGYCAFHGTSLREVKIPEGVEYIGAEAFAWSNELETLTLPTTLKSIGNNAFVLCNNLRSVTIPNGVEYIDYSAFADTALTSVTIPGSVKSIGANAFGSCNILGQIDVAQENSVYTSVDGVLFTKDMSKLVQYPAGKSGESYRIPGGVTEIEAGAFNDCRTLTSIEIPEGVQKITSENFNVVTSITIPASVTTVEASAFGRGGKDLDVYYGGTKEQWSTIQINNSSNYNDRLLNATIHYNSTGSNTPDTPAGTAKIVNLYPETGATYPGTMFDITFDKNVAENPTRKNQPVVDLNGPAPFQIHQMSDDAVVYTADSQDKVINDFRYGASRAALRINPTNASAILKDGTEYYVTMGAGFVKLADGSVSPEIKKGEWVFRCGPVATTTFTDVPSDAYYHDAVYWAVEKEITNGTSPATFTPDRTCNATEIVTLLWRAAGEPESTVQLPFTVNAGLGYAEGALRWAYEKGMIDASFNQTAPCTRASATKFIWQAAGSPSASGSSFTDVPANADYARAVAWAVSRGIVTGTSPTTFSPDKTCTRAEIVTLLYRAYK